MKVGEGKIQKLTIMTARRSARLSAPDADSAMPTRRGKGSKKVAAPAVRRSARSATAHDKSDSGDDDSEPNLSETRGKKAPAAKPSAKPRGRPGRRVAREIIEVSGSSENEEAAADEESEEDKPPPKKPRGRVTKPIVVDVDDAIENASDNPPKKRAAPRKRNTVSELEVHSAPAKKQRVATKKAAPVVDSDDGSELDDISWATAPKPSAAGKGKAKKLVSAVKARKVVALSDSSGSDFRASDEEEEEDDSSTDDARAPSDSEDDKPIRPSKPAGKAKAPPKPKREPVPARARKASPKKAAKREPRGPDDEPRPQNTEPEPTDPVYPLYNACYATSGRARCKACEQKLEKDELVISVTLEHSRFGINSYYKHVACSMLCDSVPLGGLAALSKNDEARLVALMAANRAAGMDDERIALREEDFIKREILPGKQPVPALTASLLPYQQEGLAWMVNQEAGPYRGGILADEMGMGKTIQAISCFLEQVRLDPADPMYQANGLLPGGTLIICPVIACMQWRSEIERFVAEGSVRVHIHHGPKRGKLAAALAMYDVVLTTFSIVESEGRKILGADKESCAYCGKLFLPEKLILHNKYICGPDAKKTAKQAKQQRGKAAKDKSFDGDGSSESDTPIAKKAKPMAKKPAKPVKKGSSPLHEIAWARIILDEAHYIKDRRCSTARSVFKLTSKFKWCLTGTPLQNRIGELFSLIRFLQVHPFAYYHCTQCKCEQIDFQMKGGSCDACHHSAMQHYSSFNKRILTPIQAYGYVAEGKVAMLRLQNDLLRHILLRRTKQSRADDISLPPKLIVVRRDALDEREKDFYESIYTQSKAQFNTYVSAGTLLNNYAHIFDLLIRLRQAVDHPYLVLQLSLHCVLTRDDQVIYSKSNPALQLPTPEVPAKRELPLSVDTEENAVVAPVCGFCHEEAEDVVTAECAHAFCKACVEDYMGSLLQNAKALCPTCEAPLTVNLAEEEVPPEELIDASSPRVLDGVSLKPRGKPTLLSKLPRLADFQSSTKIEALLEEIHRMKATDPSAKGIVFSQFVNMLDLIEHRLELANIRCVKLAGNMPMAMRDKLLTLFRDEPKLTIFLISLKAGGVALNLTVASHIFLMDPWWNPAAEHQAIDRTHRLGQFKPIRATRFIVANTIEDRILKLQEKKQLVFEGTVGSSTAALGRLTVEDLRFLFH
ncbi:DNA repair protein [Achlya hypogyna]|uniref:DNA repair protein n=1 Tax=Achlya hypogyna TaxID=1202772 RepID=A0A1V9YKY6_ACHHY|nr:DNA repair protein [Achlya hypogyna]